MREFRSLDGTGYFERLENSMFCGKGCMLSRFIVMVCVSIAAVGGKLNFLSGRPRDLWHCIFRHSFCFLGANYCNVFYDCRSYKSLREVFAHGGEFPLTFLIVVGQGHVVETLLTCHYSHCLFVKNRGGVRLVFSTTTGTCRFGLSA